MCGDNFWEFRFPREWDCERPVYQGIAKEPCLNTQLVQQTLQDISSQCLAEM